MPAHRGTSEQPSRNKDHGEFVINAARITAWVIGVHE
jgi:hypothetical protein